MGFDISYHPIKELEIKQWYFDALKDTSVIDKLASEHNINEFYIEKYKNTISVAKKTKATDFFEDTHGHFIAIIQGFFRTYYYTRGSAFSFLIDEKSEFKNYTKSWAKIVSAEIQNPIKNKITENYSSGVYIPANQVKKLLIDYDSNEKIKKNLDNFYSDNRISIFLTALEFSRDNDMGLLEATEVVEPNPFEMEKSTSYSNLFNCNKEGVYLYIDAAKEQIKTIEEQLNHKKVKTKKIGFWKKLFR